MQSALKKELSMRPKLTLASSSQDDAEVKAKEEPEAKDMTASVWNPNFKYKPAGSSIDLAKKFARIRRQQEKK